MTITKLGGLINHNSLLLPIRISINVYRVVSGLESCREYKLKIHHKSCSIMAEIDEIGRPQK